VTQALEARRAALEATIDPDYSPARHLLLIVLVVTSVTTLAAWGLHHVSLAELALAPVAFLFANFGEWALHRYVLHEPTKLRISYERHALIHHVLYTHDDFEIRSARELRYVLMPWFSPLAMLAATMPLVAAVALLWDGNAARIFVLVSIGYYAVYEVLHTLYHLPASAAPSASGSALWRACGAVARWGVVQWLRRQHRVHHEPRLMRACNFNVTFPIADSLLGTRRQTR
jgi:hypothetical protein